MQGKYKRGVIETYDAHNPPEKVLATTCPKILGK